MRVVFVESLYYATYETMKTLHPELEANGVNVVPFFTSKMDKLGLIRKATPVERELANLITSFPFVNDPHFIMLLNAVEILTDQKWREKLLYTIDHELEHITIDPKKGVCLRKHDIEEFVEVLSRWGGVIIPQHSEESQKLLEKLEEHLNEIEKAKEWVLSQLSK